MPLRITSLPLHLHLHLHLHLPTKSLHLRPHNRFPYSKNPILMLGSESKRRLLRSLRTSDQKTMPELVQIDKFADADGAEEETELILGGDSSTRRCGFGRAEFDSFLNRVSKWLVALLFGLVIILKHDAEVSWAVMGAVINSGLSVILKRVLNHQRPVSGLRSDPGMPSSHAQSIFYAAVLGIISLLQWKGTNFVTVSVAAFTLALASYLTWLRISHRLHTVSQVVVGGILGSACAITWVWLWHSFVHRAFTSSVWARIIVYLGSASFCVAFLFHVVRHWLTEEQ